MRIGSICLFLSCVALAADYVRADQPAAPGLDLQGDPLPAGAIARLGTSWLRHTDSINALCYSPDGKVLASAGRDRVVRLWNAATGKPLHQWGGHESEIRQLAFAPDGKTLASGDVYGVIRLWDIEKRSERCKLDYTDHGLHSLAFTADSRTLTVVGWWGHVCHWDVKTGREICKFDVSAKDPLPSSICQVGTTIFTGQATKLILSWNGSPKAVMEFSELPKHGDAPHLEVVSALAASPDLKVLASSAQDGIIRLWDVATGKRVRNLSASDTVVVCLAFSPDGRTLAAKDQENTVRFWDVATGKALRHFTIDWHNSSGMAFSPDGKTLAVAEYSAIHLWDVGTGKERLDFPGHRLAAHCIALTADGQSLASASYDGNVLLWPTDGKGQPRLLDKVRGYCLDIALAQERSLLAVAGEKGINLWDIKTQKRMRHFNWPFDYGPVLFFPDGKTLMSGDQWDNTILWSVDTDNEVHRFRDAPFIGSSRFSCSRALSADGKTLILGRGTFDVYAAATGKKQYRLGDGGGDIHAIAYSPDSRTLAAYNSDLTVTFWDVPRNTILRQTKTLEEVASLTFAPDGHTLLLGHTDGTISFLEMASLNVRHRLHGPSGAVRGFSLTPDGRKMATLCADSTILIWDLARLPHQETPDPAGLSAKALQSLWTDLGAKDATVAYRAVVQLGQDRARAPAFLAAQLRALAQYDAKQVGKLIADLHKADFKTRAAAHDALARLEDRAAPLLCEALMANPSLEMKRRIEDLLAKLDPPELSPRQVQTLRALETLERAGTPDAREVLAELARGPSVTRVAQDARNAVRRLDRENAK